VRGPDAVLLPPPGTDSVPGYDGGWIGEGAGRSAFLRYVERASSVNWSEELVGLQ
jgi:hypothetical protein